MKKNIIFFLIIGVMLNGCAGIKLAKDLYKDATFEGPDMSEEHLLDRTEFVLGISKEKLSIVPNSIHRDSSGNKTIGEIYYEVNDSTGKHYRCEMNFSYFSTLDRYIETGPMCSAIE